MRVVSLLPSATEMVCLLGGAEDLVGISHECDYPPAVQDLPRLTRSRLGTAESTQAIQADVQRLLQQTLSIFELDVDRLRAAAPDVILTQDLCEVCAVPQQAVQEAVRQVCPRARVVSLSPMSWPEVFADLRRVAQALGRESQGRAAQQSLASRALAVSERVAGRGSRPRVVTIEWLDPLMLGGHWMPEMVERAGGQVLGAEAGEKSRSRRREELQRLRPDVVLVKPCGFALEQVLAEVSTLAQVLPLDDWPAAATGEVYLADGNAYFNRPGPRLVDSLELLAACLHPAVFPDFRERYRACVRQRLPSGELIQLR